MSAHSLKRAMSSLSCFSAVSFSTSNCRCSACTLSNCSRTHTSGTHGINKYVQIGMGNWATLGSFVRDGLMLTSPSMRVSSASGSVRLSRAESRSASADARLASSSIFAAVESDTHMRDVRTCK